MRTHHLPDSAGPPPTAPHATMRAAVALILAVTLLRMAWLCWFSPYELSADEAQYWDWSRRLELSYHTKGPGIAWLIAASVRVLGVSEWGVRAAAPVCWAVMAWALARAAFTVGGSRAAAWGVLALLSVPAYSACALLMTIDVPLLACWSLAVLALLHLGTPVCPAGRAVVLGLMFGVAVGVGMLFKYTAALLLPGAAVYLWLTLGPARSRALALGSALLGASVCLIPVVIWNHSHGWSSLAHLLGHVNMPGGDLSPGAGAGAGYSPSWTLEYLGVQAVIVGPILVAMALAVAAGLRHADGAVRRTALLGLCGAAPVLLFYLLVTIRTDVEGNWPIAAYVSLVPVTGAILAGASPLKGCLRLGAHWGVGYGVVAGLGMTMLVPLARLPGIGRYVPMYRLSGSRELAGRVDAVRAELAATDAGTPIVIASRYGTTALLAFYLPDRPVVYCAGKRLGDRHSPYDDFADSDLADPALIGRSAVLVDSSRRAASERWARVLRFARLENRGIVGRSTVFVATGYAGPSEAPPP